MKSGDIEFSITEQGTLRVTFKGKESSITEAVAEYKKFNNTAEEDMTESVAEEPTENRTFDDITTVQKVQIALNNAGYDCGTPDGAKGPHTTSVIQQYQTDNGLEATGEIDDALLSSLGLK